MLIRDKKILINGITAKIGMQVNLDSDIVHVNGTELKDLNFTSKVILINKPKNVITSCSDKHNRKTVIDLLPENFRRGFFPIGRLDYLSRGALLITNNGDICYKLSHPKFAHKKTYKIIINGKLNKKDLELWRSGIDLDGKKTRPCSIDIIKSNSKNTLIKIILTEGRNRQIRRIVSLLGYKLIDLQRTDFCNISLGSLKEGEWKLIHNFKIEDM